MDELTVPGFQGRPAIAVLPFDNLSGDPDQEYFADGIAEDLITRLSAWRSFPVIARNSSFTYKGRPIDVKQISQELGVRYVVEGSVRKAGERVRISAQLIDATTGAHVWAERYDQELGDIFAIQDEITEVIVGSVAPELEKSERDRVLRKGPHNLDAWDNLQRGWWHAWQFTEADNGKAQSFFQRAIELDPHSSDAYCGLVWTHWFAVSHGWSNSAVRSAAELDRTARRAVELDSSNALAQVGRAGAYMISGQLDEALAAGNRAIDLNPSYSFAYAQHAACLGLAGRPDEAFSSAGKAIRLSPSGPMMFWCFWAAAVAQFSGQRYEEAAEWGRRAVRANPKWLFGWNVLTASYARLGRVDEARRACAELSRLAPAVSVSSIRQNLAAADPDYRDRMIDGLRKAGLKE
jgi:TolB-like protein/Flp pilus assembly protein TadD